MLTRRAKAYSSSCLSPAISSQFILEVCAAAEDRKNQWKPLILEVQGLSIWWQCWYDENLVTSACCDRHHAHAYLQTFSWKTANNGKIMTFMGGTALWCPRVQVSLNLENQDLNRQNLPTMLKISCAACPCLSQLVSVQFALLKCVSQPEIAKKIHKNPYFSVQGHPRSLNSMAIESQCTTSYWWLIVT